MPKSAILKRTDQNPPVRNGEFVATATVLQISQLAMTSPFVGDFQIIGQGRLIVGEHPDLGERFIVTSGGAFAFNTAGTRTFAVWTRGDGVHTGGDVYLGHPDNFLMYDQSEGTLGLYTAAGAGFIADSDGSLFAGDGNGAHMRWSSASRALEIRNGEDVKISLDANGDGFFDGTIYASGGRIYGQMQVDGLFRAGDVDGPSISLGRFERLNESNVLVESSEIIATDAENLPWFHVVAGGGTAQGGYFHLGAPGDYAQRLTYDGENLVISGNVYADEFILNGSGSIGGGATLTSAGKFVAGTGENVAVLDGRDALWRVYAGSATPALAPFRVNQAGEVWLDNAHIDGVIQVGGEVGGWTISTDYLAKDTGVNSTSAGLAPDDYPFYAGKTYANRASAPFRVSPAGALTASNATITGTINAAAGNITGSLYVGASGNRLHLDGANKRFESTNFVSGTTGFRIEANTGDAEFNNITARGSISTAVFNKSLITAFAGSNIVAKSASTLFNDLAVPTTIGSTTTLDVELQVGAAPFANNDIVRIKDGVHDLWLKVDAGTSQTTFWRYTATRQLGTGGGTITAGAAVVDYGQSGDGYVFSTADASNSPYISIATHAGSPWTTTTERVRLGNLNGISGTSGYGLWTNNGFFTGTVNFGAGNVMDAAGMRLDATVGKFSSASIEWMDNDDRKLSIGTMVDLLEITGAYIETPVGLVITAPDVTIYGHTAFKQSNATAAVPVMLLSQADVSEEMIEFVSTAGTGNAIEAVGSKTLTTTHFIKVTVNGVVRYIPVGTIA